ncbi:hypothetical protein OCU04_000295 [Sclerotinia nivalis]|uniref:Uncharacterized protein n=1 Tax=Sclerotinia nivalis TaxID=352851 RepID=A0A9X0AVU2_9HELO|nr:hypothetical protein OCU04_000295 [Sclerotinia nivalis]
MAKVSCSLLGKRLLHQNSSSPATIRHALVRFQGQGSCHPQMWYQVCRIPITKPDLLTEFRSAICERIWQDALTTATYEKQTLEEERTLLLSEAGAAFESKEGLVEKFLGEQRNLTWEEHKADLDRNIQEKTQEINGIEDMYHERHTAQAMRVLESGVPGIGSKGFTGSIDGVQLHWYGSHKPLLMTDILSLHEARFGRVMRLLMERNPVPGSDELSVKYTVPEVEKSTGDTP